MQRTLMHRRGDGKYPQSQTLPNSAQGPHRLRGGIRDGPPQILSKLCSVSNSHFNEGLERTCQKSPESGSNMQGDSPGDLPLPPPTDPQANSSAPQVPCLASQPGTS